MSACARIRVLHSCQGRSNGEPIVSAQFPIVCNLMGLSSVATVFVSEANRTVLTQGCRICPNFKSGASVVLETEDVLMEMMFLFEENCYRRGMVCFASKAGA